MSIYTWPVDLSCLSLFSPSVRRKTIKDNTHTRKEHKKLRRFNNVLSFIPSDDVSPRSSSRLDYNPFSKLDAFLESSNCSILVVKWSDCLIRPNNFVNQMFFFVLFFKPFSNHITPKRRRWEPGRRLLVTTCPVTTTITTITIRTAKWSSNITQPAARC